MTKKRIDYSEAMYKLSWTVLFLFFNISIMGWELLPDFIGWVFAFSACSYVEEKDTNKFMMIICIVMVIYDFFGIFGIPGSLGVLGYVVGITKIWLFYAIISAVIEPVIHREEGRKLGFWRNFHLVVSISRFLLIFVGATDGIFAIIYLACMFLSAIRLFVLLRRAANLLAAEEDFRPETLAPTPSE